MKTILKVLGLMVLSGILLQACVREDPLLKAAREYLNAQEVFGVYLDKQAVFIFDASNHQLADNLDARSFRIQNDNQSKLLQISLDKIPELGLQCVVTVVSKGISGIEKNYTVEVTKMDESEQILWLWDSSTKIGFVMFYRF